MRQRDAGRALQAGRFSSGGQLPVPPALMGLPPQALTRAPLLCLWTQFTPLPRKIQVPGLKLHPEIKKVCLDNGEEAGYNMFR